MHGMGECRRVCVHVQREPSVVTGWGWMGDKPGLLTDSTQSQLMRGTATARAGADESPST